MSYYLKLKDPRWQKKRLEILNRDQFQCTCCGDTENELNVHHSYYEYGKELWEYEDDTLFTLCKPCHESHTISSRNIKHNLRYIQYDQLYEFEKIVEKCCMMNPYELDLVNKYCEKIIEDGA
jgi:5-methylcytosine-specific restriction endonuclease McrA